MKITQKEQNLGYGKRFKNINKSDIVITLTYGKKTN